MATIKMITTVCRHFFLGSRSCEQSERVSTTKVCHQANLLIIGIVFLTVLPKSVFASSFKISPDRATFNQNCTSKVDIILDTEGATTNAADIIIDYDPSKIDIIDADSSTAGTQIYSGNVFTNYFGNIVDTNLGVIRLTGASFVGSFNGSGTFATIQFKPKVNSGSFTFNVRFTGAGPYNTLDSNIADINTSNDTLSSVDNGFFTLDSGSCVSDTLPPDITFIAPINGQQNVPPAANMVFDISDAGSGVNINSVEIVLNGTVYLANSSQITLTGNSSLYHFTLRPTDPLYSNQANTLLVKASDFAGNSRTSSISFNLAPTITGSPTPVIPNPTCPIIIPTITPTITPTASPSAELLSTTPTSIPTPTTNPNLGNIIPIESPSITPTPSDRNSPQIEFVKPQAKENTSINPDIQVRFSDNESGVNRQTIKLILNDTTYTAFDPHLLFSGTPASYLGTLNLPEPLKPNLDYTLTAFVSDLSGNSVSQSITFHTKNSFIAQLGTNTGSLFGLLLFLFLLSPSFYFLYQTIRRYLHRDFTPLGVVYHSHTLEPLPYVRIVIYDESDRIIATTTTNVFGVFAGKLKHAKYRFSPILKGYTFPSSYSAHPLDYPKPYHGQLITYTASTNFYIEIPLDSAQTLPDTFPKSLLLPRYGTVTNSQGHPLANLTLELYQTKFDQPVAVRRTDSEGHYRFIVPHGQYQLKCPSNNLKHPVVIDTRHLVGGYTSLNPDLRL